MPTLEDMIRGDARGFCLRVYYAALIISLLFRHATLVYLAHVIAASAPV